MDPVWKDGIQAMLRAAKLGVRMALDDDEVAVVRSLLTTILAAERGVR